MIWKLGKRVPLFEWAKKKPRRQQYRQGQTCETIGKMSIPDKPIDVKWKSLYSTLPLYSKNDVRHRKSQRYYEIYWRRRLDTLSPDHPIIRHKAKDFLVCLLNDYVWTNSCCYYSIRQLAAKYHMRQERVRNFLVLFFSLGILIPVGRLAGTKKSTFGWVPIWQFPNKPPN